MNFKPAIETLMTDFGYNQADLARKTGLAPAYISQLMTDRRSWNLNNLAKIAKAFDMQLWHLVRMGEE